MWNICMVLSCVHLSLSVTSRQCTKMAKQFITLTVHVCVQQGGREAPLCVCLSATAETSPYKLWLIVGRHVMY